MTKTTRQAIEQLPVDEQKKQFAIKITERTEQAIDPENKLSEEQRTQETVQALNMLFKTASNKSVEPAIEQLEVIAGNIRQSIPDLDGLKQEHTRILEQIQAMNPRTAGDLAMYLVGLDAGIRNGATYAAQTVAGIYKRIQDAIELLQGGEHRLHALLYPYFEKVLEEHPDLEEESIGVVMEKAAHLAAADGLEVPEDLRQALKDNPLIKILETERVYKVSSLRPITHIMPNNLLAQELQKKEWIDGGAQKLPVLPASKKRPEPISSYVMVTLENDAVTVKGTPRAMTEHEILTANAVYSLWTECERQKRPPVISVEDILRAMPGGRDKVTQQQREAIIKDLMTGRRMNILLDATAEMQARGIIGKNGHWRIDDYFYNFAIVDIKPTHSSQTIKGYLLHNEPPVLRYARMLGQVIEVPTRYLEICTVKDGKPTGERLLMTQDRQAITSYLIRRIAVMKNDLEKAAAEYRRYEKKRQKDTTLPEKPPESFRKQSNVILFDSIFETVAPDLEDKKQKRILRNFCIDVMEYWKATGYITGYKIQVKGQKINSLEVEI